MTGSFAMLPLHIFYEFPSNKLIETREVGKWAMSLENSAAEMPRQLWTSENCFSRLPDLTDHPPHPCTVFPEPGEASPQ